MTLSVWMTPTPFEASSDTTNSIHQIVTRLDKHLPDYDVRLVENPDNAILYAAHAGQGSSVPIHVAHYHGLYPTAQGMDGGYYSINAHVIRNLKTALAITAPSNWIADVIRRDQHISPRIIPWGVDTQEWTPGTDPHVYVLWNKARVDAVSNPAPMLELARRAPQIPFLTTFGDGGQNVKTIGRQPYETMKQYVRNASIYLSTNVETWGIGVAEAMASGVPILGFRQGAIQEYVEHGVSGFLAEPGDMDGLYEGLHYCLKYRDTLGANAREAIKAYTWDRVAREFAAVYRSVLEPHTGAKVSVVIPCHNYARYLPTAIESVLNQETNFDYEIIVVCDRCTDESEAVAKQYQSRGVIVLLADNGNLSATRNQGIQHGSGEYIVCLDADDRLGDVRFLQTLSDTLDTDRTLGVAFTSIQFMDSEGNLGHKSTWPDGYDYDKQLHRNNQIPSCCMFRRQAWERAGGFKEYFVYAQDAEFWTLVGALGYGAKHVVNEGWFHYRLHDQSQSMVHRTGKVPEPDWTEFYPYARDNQRPFASDGKAPRGSWPVRFYHEPTVTVIIPVGKGHERAVKDALHSVEGQTYRYWNVIVVNDTDKPLDLTGFPFARLIVTPKANSGAGKARNTGAKLAKTPFLVFLDADDMLKPRFLELALAAYQQIGRYVYSDWLTQEQQTNFQTHTTPDYSLDAFRNAFSIHPVTTLIPRKWFEAVGGFDETMPAYEDVDLYLKFLTRGFCGVRIPEPLLIYNLNSGQRRKQGKVWESEFRALMKQRYGAFMESNSMCNCVEPPAGKKAAPPTPENVAEFKETFGDMMKARLVWEYAGTGAVTFKGPATKVNYGRRSRGDIFMVWEKDVTLSSGVFELVNEYTPEPEKTVIPEPPPEMTVTIKAPDLVLTAAHTADGEPVNTTETFELTRRNPPLIDDNGLVIVREQLPKTRNKPGRKAKTR